MKNEERSVKTIQCQDETICIIGLGYVGLTLAATMADVGFKVVGVEIQDLVLQKLKTAEPHFFEPGLKEKLSRAISNRRIEFHKHVPKDSASTVYIITVGTPLGKGKNKTPRMDMVESVTKEIASVLKEGDMILMRSTVMLGTTRKVVLPILQQTGKKFDLAFCPERTLEGAALKELRELPQIIGGYTPESTIRAAQIYQMLTPTVVRVRDPETAEMIKLIDNAQRDVVFAYGNEVARACDAAGISAVEVIRSGKIGYPRHHLFMPGPVGGPCLEKDSYILAEGLKPFGIEPEITLTARRLNERQPSEAVSAIKKTLGTVKGFSKTPVITLMGLAFKGRPITDDLRGTMAYPIFDALKKEFPGATFKGFDPVVHTNEIKTFGLAPVSSLKEAFSGTDLMVIMNNHPDFAAMPIETLAEGMKKPSLIYDFWNSFDAESLRLPGGTGYMALGSHGRAVLPET